MRPADVMAITKSSIGRNFLVQLIYTLYHSV